MLQLGSAGVRLDIDFTSNCNNNPGERITLRQRLSNYFRSEDKVHVVDWLCWASSLSTAKGLLRPSTVEMQPPTDKTLKYLNILQIFRIILRLHTISLYT